MHVSLKAGINCSISFLFLYGSFKLVTNDGEENDSKSTFRTFTITVLSRKVFVVASVFVMRERVFVIKLQAEYNFSFYPTLKSSY